MKAALLTTAAILALLPSASAQEPQPIRVNYVYEWIHVKPEPSPPGISDFVGGLWMSDITSTTPGIGQFSQIEGYIRQGNDIILDCDMGVGRSPGPSHDIVQVGPFAQQATGDLAPLLEDPFFNESNCLVAPTEMTINCPYFGLPISVAPGHEVFENKGTYKEPAPLNHPMPANNTFVQRGQRGPIRCLLNIDGLELQMQGTLTRITETRFGLFVPHQPTWIEPHFWIRVPEDIRRPEDIRPPR